MDPIRIDTGDSPRVNLTRAQYGLLSKAEHDLPVISLVGNVGVVDPESVLFAEVNPKDISVMSVTLERFILYIPSLS